MSTNNKFTNPYAELGPSDLCRTTIVVSRRHKAVLNGAYGLVGTLQTTINILLSKLINELERANRTEYDPDWFEYNVANAAIVFPGDVGRLLGSAIANAAPETSDRDVGPGTQRVARAAARAQKQSSDVPGASTRPGESNKKRAKKP